MAYVYQADLWCDDCGRAIAADLDAKEIEDTGETDVYPQYAIDGGGESDSPQHCGAGEGCINAIVLRQKSPMTGRRQTYRIGAWLENDLTSDGVEYVRGAVKDKRGLCRRLWRQYYRDVL